MDGAFEKGDLEGQQSELKRLLEFDEAIYEVMTDEFEDIDNRFGEDRKTKIIDEDGEVNEMDMIKNSRSGK